jgi:hypothetical protein
MIKGNMLSPELIPLIDRAKFLLNNLKTYKLTLRQNRHPPNEIWIAENLVKHLFNEVFEFERERIITHDYPNMLQELADISNCIDALALMVVEKEPML